MTTRFYWDERCLWHAGGAYAFTAPVGGLVQPLAAGGLPENPETKRRLVNLMRVTGLLAETEAGSAAPAGDDALLRVHTQSYIDAFKTLSAGGGGELGERTPFLTGGFEIAALSAGLVTRAVEDVLSGAAQNAYALSRPPGHHCLPETPMGFCLLANIAIAVETAIAARPGLRVAVIDWDVHHGNGTQDIFYARPDILTISLHQENNYPLRSGPASERGAGPGLGFNVNIPLPAGCGDAAYRAAFQKIVAPSVAAFGPDLIVIACGFDASGVDPLARMIVSAAGFAALTDEAMALADAHSSGRLVMAHEGGYAEAHVPFCGHAVIARMAGSAAAAPDPFATRIDSSQPTPEFLAFQMNWIDRLAEGFASAA